MDRTIAEVRRFNRFYTRQIGLLDERLLDSPFTLPEARILYELAQGGEPTAADLSRRLGMDKAQLSRILSSLRERALTRETQSPHHARHRLLSLTAKGRRAFDKLERAQVAEIAALLGPLDAPARSRLTSAIRDVRTIMGDEAAGEIVLRDPRPGDFGWITHRQSALYAEEQGWDTWQYEGLMSGILARFVADYDPAAEQGWIAERDGRILGSIFLMRGEAPGAARLRLLYVEPEARGCGLGGRLVAACVGRARELGYRKLGLWTVDILAPARRLYQAAGFRLVREARENLFGQDLNTQIWELEL